MAYMYVYVRREAADHQDSRKQNHQLLNADKQIAAQKKIQLTSYQVSGGGPLNVKMRISFIKRKW